MSMFQRLAVHPSCSTGSCPCTSARKPSTGRLRCRRIVSGEASRPRSTSSATEGAAVQNRRSDSAHQWCGASACTIPTGPCTVAIVIASGMLPSAARQRGYPGYFRMGTPLLGWENGTKAILAASATPPPLGSVTHRLRLGGGLIVCPPRLRSQSSALDGNRIRFDDGFCERILPIDARKHPEARAGTCRNASPVGILDSVAKHQSTQRRERTPDSDAVQ